MRITARQLRQLIKGEIGKLREAADTDGDGTPDYRDLDSDNDGISDREEATPKASALELDWVDNYIDFYTLENLTKRKAKKTLRDIFDEMHPHPSLNNDKSKDVMLHYILVAIKKYEEESMDNPWDDDDDPADWLGPEGEYVQEVQRMKITAGQLRRIIREVLEEDKGGKGKCPDDGCVQKRQKGWVVISNKTGECWGRSKREDGECTYHDTREDAEDALAAYHSGK